MINLDDLLGQTVLVELPGLEKTGYLIDYGDDIFVLFDGRQYVYIPLTHVQQLRAIDPAETTFATQPDESQIGTQTPKISLTEMLTNAIGTFIEIWAAGKQPLFGTLLHLGDDYLVLASPIYKTIYVSLAHLKWLIPYDYAHIPYSLPLPPETTAFDPSKEAQAFEEHVKRQVGRLVVFDVGEQAEKIGLLQAYSPNGVVELVTADERKVYWNLQHLKSIHIP